MNGIEKGIKKRIIKIEQKVNLLACVFLLGKVLQNMLKNQQLQPITLEYNVFVLTVVLQCVELSFGWSGILKTDKLWTRTLYIIPKSIIILFVSQWSTPQLFLPLALSYSIWDVCYYADLVFPNHFYLSFVVYFLPLLVNICIPYYWLLLMNDYIKANAQTIPYSTINWIRLTQLSGIIHALIYYLIIYKQFRQYYSVKDNKKEE